MRILVVTLVKREPPGQSWYGARLYARSLQSIFRLEWDGQLDYLFLVGGDQQQIGAHERSVAYTNITRKYEQARQHALACGYDALFEVESDIIVPPDALKKLTAVSAGVAYGVYVWRHGRPLWNAYTTVHDRVGISVSENVDLARRVWGHVIDVAGIGDGCTLIWADVLKRIRRWTDQTGYVSCDWRLAEDCQRLGIVQRCHLGVVCGHMTMTPSPRILWPDPEASHLYRVEFLEPPGYIKRSGDKIVAECNTVGEITEVPV